MIRRLLSAALLIVAPATMQAQFPAPPPQAPRPAKAIAPEDVTGYWVSIVTEDWRWRMVTPAKGDYTSVPLNPDGRKAAGGWQSVQGLWRSCHHARPRTRPHHVGG
jgi:hypothetical protein